ncbi:hypothetical protein PoB_004417400 [Plakobranchus ocellatus]|uniref:Uncharacterized protein n=1 Tax=Plakobranchus ocellatus TaxID=259542 RepID=A0AAV4BH53_9GAST|nr:hypothetical protein PoB_004417400 [Plakobranchus ocellatus]
MQDADLLRKANFGQNHKTGDKGKFGDLTKPHRESSDFSEVPNAFDNECVIHDRLTALYALQDFLYLRPETLGRRKYPLLIDWDDDEVCGDGVVGAAEVCTSGPPSSLLTGGLPLGGIPQLAGTLADIPSLAGTLPGILPLNSLGSDYRFLRLRQRTPAGDLSSSAGRPGKQDRTSHKLTLLTLKARLGKKTPRGTLQSISEKGKNETESSCEDKQSERKPSEKVALPHTNDQDAAFATKSTKHNSPSENINPAGAASSKELRLIKTVLVLAVMHVLLIFPSLIFFIAQNLTPELQPMKKYNNMFYLG